METIKIGIIGLNNAKNLGDPLICGCTKSLLEQELIKRNISYNIKIIELLPKKNHNKTKGNKKGIIMKLSKFRRLFRFLKEKKIQIEGSEKQYQNYYEKEFKDIDFIVFAGGGLIKYAQQENLNVSIAAAVETASKRGMIAAFHACGVEGYDNKAPGCQRLSKAINSENVRVVTTRDDLETLNKFYKKREDLYTGEAADSAVFSDELIGIKASDNSNVIGIGVIRGNIFQNYGHSLDEEGLLLFYKNVIKGLQYKKKEFRLFCNGYSPDYEFAKRILHECGLNQEYLLKKPADYKELVEQISGFRGVLAARLHACIISYSLGVPVIGLCWNEKLKHFGKAIGYPNRFINVNEFNSEEVIKMLINAIEEGYELQKWKEYKQTSKNSIAKIIDSFTA